MNKFVALVFASFLIFAITPSVSAQTKKGTASVQKQTVSKKVEYALPYPGILPDNPLYIIKAARDRIMDFLIVDPVRKAEFYVLQADKRLVMTTMLLDKVNAVLAETTLSKGETYMEKAVSTVVNYKAGGKEVPGYLVEHLTLSLAKHGEVLSERLETAAEPAKTFLSAALEKVKTLETQAEKVK